MNILLHGGETLFDSEWLQLANLFQTQWSETIQEILCVLNPEDETEGFELLHGHASRLSSKSSATK